MSYQIRDDEHCVVCKSQDLRVAEEDPDNFVGGVLCVELYCNNCQTHFVVCRDEILPDGTLRHDRR